MTGVSIQKEKILRWNKTNIKSPSKFIIDLCGIRIVCHHFVYLWESV